MTIDLDLATLTLGKGSHSPDSGEACLLEAAAYMAGEDWSDHPECVCTVLGTFGRDLNDVLPDDKRQALKQFLPATREELAAATAQQRAKWILGTAGDGYTEQRSYMALDWLIRVYLTAWLSATERIPASVAQAIRDLPPIVDMATAEAAGVLVREARDKAAAARDAAWAAAGGAAWAAAGGAAASPAGATAGAAARAAARDAAGGAAWAAAGGAAGDAAWAAAGGAAWAAARAAAWAAAGDAEWGAARAAARDAAGGAAWAAAGGAAWAAAGGAAWAAAGGAAWAAAGAAAWAAEWGAARAAARDALSPTVAELQDSAIELYVRMVGVGRAG